MGQLVFANAWGWWALLAVPAILAVHFLQRASRREPVSTLFLIERLAPESVEGRRFDRIRNSVPLWLQLAVAALLAALLAGPGCVGRETSQTVVLVLDESASMSAFRERALAGLPGVVEGLRRAAGRTRWSVVGSHPARGPYYVGDSAAEAVASLAKWRPTAGGHDAGRALREGVLSVRGRGAVVWVTDRVGPVPEGVVRWACGEEIANVGFAGATVEGNRWRAFVVNRGAGEAARVMRRGGGEERLVIGPGAMVETSGTFGEGEDRVELVLDGGSERFEIDDRMPLVRPQPKRLGISVEAGGAHEVFVKRLLAATEAWDEGGDDLRVMRYDPFSPRPIDAPGLVLVEDAAQPKRWVPGLVWAERHPLVEGLAWGGLRVGDGLKVPVREGDQVLVWAGERPLLWLRDVGRGEALVVNFDLRQSNAVRWPAVVLAMHRFLERARERKAGVAVVNAETGQRLGPGVRAPDLPGFFETPIARGAAQFADAREGDFAGATSVDEVAGLARQLAEGNARREVPVAFGLLAVLGLLVGAWGWKG